MSEEHTSEALTEVYKISETSWTHLELYDVS